MTLTTPRIPSPSVNKRPSMSVRRRSAKKVTNSISHGVGLAGALVAFPLLVIAASQRGDITGIVSVSVFATTMVLLYLASTLFHALPPGRAKRGVSGARPFRDLSADRPAPIRRSRWACCAARGAGRCSASSGASPWSA